MDDSYYSMLFYRFPEKKKKNSLLFFYGINLVRLVISVWVLFGAEHLPFFISNIIVKFD